LVRLLSRLDSLSRFRATVDRMPQHIFASGAIFDRATSAGAALSGEEDIRPLRGDGSRAGPQVETAIGVHLHEAGALPDKDQ